MDAESVIATTRIFLLVMGAPAVGLWCIAQAESESVWARSAGSCAIDVCVTPFVVLVLAAHLVVVGARLFRREFGRWDLLPMLLTVVAGLGGWYLGVEARVEAADPFYEHREQFVETAETLLRECDASCPCIGPTDFYHEACLYEDESGFTEIEFRLSAPSFSATPLLLYLPAVDSESQVDPCSRVAYRRLVVKIDDHWYVCWESID
jgi:hypothetical protein